MWKMEQEVSVVEVKGSTARVRGVRASACGHCAGQSACGTMGSWVERHAEMEVDNALGAKVGDRVIVSVPDGQLLKATFKLYGMPMLVFMLVGLVVRQLAVSMSLAAPDLWAAVAGLASIGACYAWIMRHGGRHEVPAGRIVRIENGGIIPIRPL